MTPEAKKRLSRLMKKRWAKMRKEGKTTLGDEKVWGKEAQRETHELHPKYYLTITNDTQDGVTIERYECDSPAEVVTEIAKAFLGPNNIPLVTIEWR